MTALFSITDTHCHLNLNHFDEDLEKVLERASDAGVDRILIPGLDIDTSRQSVRLSEQHPALYAAVGVHPNSADSWNSDTIKELNDLCQHPKVRAVGEIGLDYYRQHTAPEAQKAIFLSQLDLASEYQLPVVIHNRASIHDLWPILTAWRSRLSKDGRDLANRPGVLHAFDENLEIAKKVLEQHFFIGIGGPVTYSKSTTLQQILSNTTLDQIMTETDSPYQTPNPYRGSRNEPGYVKIVVEKIAEIVDLSYENVARITSRNADRLFLWRAAI